MSFPLFDRKSLFGLECVNSTQGNVCRVCTSFVMMGEGQSVFLSCNTRLFKHILAPSSCEQRDLFVPKKYFAGLKIEYSLICELNFLAARFCNSAQSNSETRCLGRYPQFGTAGPEEPLPLVSLISCFHWDWTGIHSLVRTLESDTALN